MFFSKTHKSILLLSLVVGPWSAFAEQVVPVAAAPVIPAVATTSATGAEAEKSWLEKLTEKRLKEKAEQDAIMGASKNSKKEESKKSDAKNKEALAEERNSVAIPRDLPPTVRDNLQLTIKNIQMNAEQERNAYLEACNQMAKKSQPVSMDESQARLDAIDEKARKDIDSSIAAAVRLVEIDKANAARKATSGISDSESAH